MVLQDGAVVTVECKSCSLSNRVISDDLEWPWTVISAPTKPKLLILLLRSNGNTFFQGHFGHVSCKIRNKVVVSLKSCKIKA